MNGSGTIKIVKISGIFLKIVNCLTCNCEKSGIVYIHHEHINKSQNWFINNVYLYSLVSNNFHKPCIWPDLQLFFYNCIETDTMGSWQPVSVFEVDGLENKLSNRWQPFAADLSNFFT